MTYNPLVILQYASKCDPILICIPGAGASTSSFMHLLNELPENLNVIGLEPRGLNVDELPFFSVEEAAAAYLIALSTIKWTGKRFLLAHSFGGWVALELAKISQKSSSQFQEIILLDSPSPGEVICEGLSGNKREVYEILINLYNLILATNLTIPEFYLRNLSDNALFDLFHEILVEAKIFPRNCPPHVLRGVVNVTAACVITKYRPESNMQTSVSLAIPTFTDINEQEKMMNRWRAYCNPRKMNISGNHLTMLQNPGASEIAAYIISNIAHSSNCCVDSD